MLPCMHEDYLYVFIRSMKIFQTRSHVFLSHVSHVSCMKITYTSSYGTKIFRPGLMPYLSPYAVAQEPDGRAVGAGSSAAMDVRINVCVVVDVIVPHTGVNTVHRSPHCRL